MKLQILYPFIAVMALLHGCATTYNLEQPIAFEQQKPSINKHMGVVVSAETASFSLQQRDFIFLLGDAVNKNIKPSLERVYTTVSIATGADQLPANIDYLAYVRFSPETKINIPFIRAEDKTITVVLDVEVYNKTGKSRIWRGRAVGAKTDKEPGIYLGLINLSAETDMFTSLLRDSVGIALTDLNEKLQLHIKI